MNESATLPARAVTKRSIHLCFKLSMPSNNAWNGKWSGQDRRYEVVHSFIGKARVAKAQELAAKSYRHNFGDGWVALVSVREVSPQDAKTIKRLSDGFCGYEWMITSIIANGEIKS